jgi:hypothetical protein
MFVLSITMLLSASHAEDFTCFKIFRDQYKVFVHKDLIFNDVSIAMPMKLYGIDMNGYLHFNKCSNVSVKYSCGEDVVAKGRFVYVNYKTSKNAPKCIIFREKDPEQWRYTTFKQDAESIKLEGVQINEPEMEIEFIGGNPGFNDILKDLIHEQIKQNIPGAKHIYDLFETNKDAQKIQKKETSENSLEMDLNVQKKNSIIEKTKDQETNPDQKPSNILKRILTESTEEKKKEVDRFMLNGMIESNFYYFCNEDEDPYIKANFDSKKNALIVNEYSKNGCLVQFNFLKFLSQFSVLTGLIFASIGLSLLLGGFKIYTNIFLAFIPVVIIMLGFFLFFALMDKTETPFSNLLMLCGILLIMILCILIAIYIQNYFFFIFAFLVSFQFAYYMKNFLEQYFSCFEYSYMYTILTLIFYLILVSIYLFTEDFFVILSTVIFGSILLIISLRYLGITSYDLLFDTQLNKFYQFDHFDPEAKKIIIAFVSVIVFGFIFQTVMLCYMRRNEKNEEDEEDEEDVLEVPLEDSKKNQKDFDPESQTTQAVQNK